MEGEKKRNRRKAERRKGNREREGNGHSVSSCNNTKIWATQLYRSPMEEEGE
jgi:hypothetical protein